MSKRLTYRSVLAPYIHQLLDTRESIGFGCNNIMWSLKEFDDIAFDIGMEIPRIDSSFVKKWRTSRLMDSDETLYRKLSQLAQLAKLMCRCGCECYIPRLPKKPKSDFIPYIFSKEQMSLIFKECDKVRIYDKCMNRALIAMPALIRLLYGTGMRISEALSLYNKDVDISNGVITLHKTKNRKERLVPLSDSLVSVLSQYVEYRDRIPVKRIAAQNQKFFVKANGLGFSKDTAYYFFRKVLDRCGIPYIGGGRGPRVHDLRHTYAVHAMVQMCEQGQDIYSALPTLATYLGHKSTSSTELYLRLTLDMNNDINTQCSEINTFIYPKTLKP